VILARRMPARFGVTARNLQELAAFRLCEELMKVVEKETATGTVAKRFRFCDQLNDAALDAASDVAEGFVRYYPGEFARFLDFAICLGTRSRNSALEPRGTSFGTSSGNLVRELREVAPWSADDDIRRQGLGAVRV
jgi:hypothetical protein